MAGIDTERRDMKNPPEDPDPGHFCSLNCGLVRANMDCGSGSQWLQGAMKVIAAGAGG
jgi:hypothetical protein